MTSKPNAGLSPDEIQALLPGGTVDDHEENPEPRLADAIAAELQKLFDRFSARVTARLHGPLRGDTEIAFGQLREVTRHELLARMGRPTCILVFALDPVASRAIIELPYGTFFPLLDRLLGGGQHPCPTMRRPLTRIERRLAARLAGYFIDAMSDAWAPYAEVTPKLLAIECDPRVLDIGESGDRWVMGHGEVRVPIQRGACYVSFLRDDIQLIERVLRLGPYAAIVDRAPTELPGKRPEELTAVIGTARLESANWAADALVPGQVLWTDASPEDPVLVYEGSVLKYVAEMGLDGGAKAVRILRQVDQTHEATDVDEQQPGSGS